MRADSAETLNRNAATRLRALGQLFCSFPSVEIRGKGMWREVIAPKQCSLGNVQQGEGQIPKGHFQ